MQKAFSQRTARWGANAALLAAMVRIMASAHAAGDQKPTPPNVIIVMTDDQGLGDFSFTGNPVLQTPNFDAFAKEAVRLADFHAAPMCTPTRGQLMTGLAAIRNGATSVIAGRTFLRPGLPTLPEVFGRAGYATGMFGKWHLGDSYPHRPHDKGFQDSLYHLGFGQLYSAPEAGWPLIDGRAFRNGVEERYRGHCTDLWFDEALAWMKRQREAKKPFLCYLPTNAAHGPCIDLKQYIAPFRQAGLPAGQAGFFGMIAHLDARFGDLERFLTAEGLRDDTIVIFTTDNGGTVGVKTFNAGLRSKKTTYYEGGHRVPCWIRWPRGGFGPPRDVDVPTQNTDLFPTLCDLCCVPAPERPPSDLPYAGTSLAKMLRGQPDALPERMLVVQYGQQPRKHDACVIRGPWRLVKGEELYDVSADRAQDRDVAAEHPEIVARLRADYESWWEGVAGLVNQFVPQSIGAPQQPVVELTSGDWQGIFADNVARVSEAAGGPTGGRWNITVERPGTYEFTLRRWPPRADAAIGATADLRGEEGAKRPPAAAGKSFPSIAKAHVRIAGQEAEAATDAQAKKAVVRMTLPAGITALEAWFADAANEPLCGAFFVTVRGGD